MYTAKINKQEDLSTIKAFIKANSFGLLVSTDGHKPIGTHIPIELEVNSAGLEVLTGHVARANQQWKTFNNGQEVLAVFTGPHAYISSSWYDHENVPTWNYIAVHVYGKIKIIEGDALLLSLKKLVDKYEVGRQNAVSVDTMSDKLLSSQVKAIVGFEVEITDIQATYKLSQNRDDKNHEAIVEHLAKSEDGTERQMGDIMKNERTEKKKVTD